MSMYVVCNRMNPNSSTVTILLGFLFQQLSPRLQMISCMKTFVQKYSASSFYPSKEEEEEENSYSDNFHKAVNYSKELSTWPFLYVW